MSKNLILIITIFSFWLFIYLTDVKKEKSEEKNNFADDGVMYTNVTQNPNYKKDGVTMYQTPIGATIPTTKKPEYNKNGVTMYQTPIGPVKPKGEV